MLSLVVVENSHLKVVSVYIIESRHLEVVSVLLKRAVI